MCTICITKGLVEGLKYKMVTQMHNKNYNEASYTEVYKDLNEILQTLSCSPSPLLAPEYWEE